MGTDRPTDPLQLAFLKDKCPFCAFYTIYIPKPNKTNESIFSNKENAEAYCVRREVN